MKKKLSLDHAVSCAIVALAFGVAACGAEGGASSDSGAPGTDLSATEVRGATMRPGDNCLRCHSKPGKYGAPEWTAGGTIYASKDAPFDADGVPGVRVTITDVDGRRATAITNSVGNFYTREPLTKPFRVAIEYEGRRKEMPIEAPAGSCNACHSWPNPSGGAPGRIFVP
jgi:hypothetical protein